MIVADANLIVYLIIPGTFTTDAETALARDPDWRVPALWRSEVRNALLQHIRADHLELTQAVAALADTELLLAGGEEHVDSQRVLELARESGASAYDCEYVAVAERLGVPLVTGDRRVLNAFPELAVSLEDFARRGL